MSKTDISNGGDTLVNALQYIVSLCIYFFVGWATDYWLYVEQGGTTDWSVPATYFIILLWPFILMWHFLIICVLICVAIVVILFIISLVNSIT